MRGKRYGNMFGNARFFEKNIGYYFLYSAGCILLSLVCFYKLGASPIQMWDEARHGISAYEMLQRGSWLVNTYRYEPDYWNLKPILSFWPTMLSFKIWGYSEFAMRFPAGASYMILGLVGTIWLKKETNHIGALLFLYGCSAAKTIIFIHGVRSGDADGVFLLFFFCAMVALFYARRVSYCYSLWGLFFSLAFLTKSFHAIPILVIGVFYYFYNKSWQSLRVKDYLITSLSAFIPLMGWGIWRFSYDNVKFLEKMITVDLLNRSEHVVEGHAHSVFYYFNILYHDNEIVTCVVLIMLLVILLGKLKLWAILKDDGIVFLLWIIVPLILFTSAKSRLMWYCIMGL